MKYAHIALITAVAIASQSHAAVFTVQNKGSKAIEAAPMWSGSSESYTTIKPGQEVRFDSGLNAVTGIRWRLVTSNNPTQGTECYQYYKATKAPHFAGALNLGGNIQILDAGSYSWYFGVDGSGSAVATPGR
ncbi:MAG TPA: hypothetical protein PLU71_01840 [Candidatus Dependentiae bacterium]|nr:hypothetical protein [Candidatus Dependentiae bacterium]HRQ62573.1 hypothetical protein [Candidatus Dependentiae bacterium]